MRYLLTEDDTICNIITKVVRYFNQHVFQDLLRLSTFSVLRLVLRRSLHLKVHLLSLYIFPLFFLTSFPFSANLSIRQGHPFLPLDLFPHLSFVPLLIPSSFSQMPFLYPLHSYTTQISIPRFLLQRSHQLTATT